MFIYKLTCKSFASFMLSHALRIGQLHLNFCIIGTRFRQFFKGKTIFALPSLDLFCCLFIFIVVCLLAGVTNPPHPAEKRFRMA